MYPESKETTPSEPSSPDMPEPRTSPEPSPDKPDQPTPTPGPPLTPVPVPPGGSLAWYPRVDGVNPDNNELRGHIYKR